MSEIVDTREGSFRRVTDGTNKWWLWECPACTERQSVDLDQQGAVSCVKCGHVGHDLGRALVAQMQARILTGQKPSHDEGKPHEPTSGGVDGP